MPSSSSLGIVTASEGGSVEKKESLLRWRENEDTMIRETNPSKREESTLREGDSSHRRKRLYSEEREKLFYNIYLQEVDFFGGKKMLCKSLIDEKLIIKIKKIHTYKLCKMEIDQN